MGEKITTIEELAAMIHRTMASKEDLKGMASKEDLKGMASKEDLKELRSEMNSQFQGVTNRFDYLDARVGRIEADIHEFRDEIVYRHEFEDVLGRVKYLEKNSASKAACNLVTLSATREEWWQTRNIMVK